MQEYLKERTQSKNWVRARVMDAVCLAIIEDSFWEGMPEGSINKIVEEVTDYKMSNSTLSDEVIKLQIDRLMREYAQRITFEGGF